MKSTRDINAANVDKDIESLIDFYSYDIQTLMQEHDLSKEEVIKYYNLIESYLLDKKVCDRCPGLSMCPKADQYIQATLEKKDGELTRKVGYCTPYREKLKVDSLFLLRDYPEEFSNVVASSLTKTKRVMSLFKSLADTRQNETKPFLYVHGQLGSGRTYLLSAYANTFIQSGRTAAFMDCNTRIDELKSMTISDKAQFERAIKVLCECDLLILDEFGNWYLSEYTIANVLYPLIAYRAKNKKFTVISSDYSLSDVAFTFGDTQSAKVRGKQVISLIKSALNEEVVVQKGVEQKL